MDDDSADLTNLNRMVGLTHSDACAKRPKLDVVARRYLEGVPEASVRRVEARWQDAQDVLKGCHVIFGCVDSYTAREELERFCRRYLIAYIDIGMDAD